MLCCPLVTLNSFIYRFSYFLSSDLVTHIICSLMLETGCSGRVHWDNPEGWDGEGGGRGFRTRDTCTPVADAHECMAKTTTIL